MMDLEHPASGARRPKRWIALLASCLAVAAVTPAATASTRQGGAPSGDLVKQSYRTAMRAISTGLSAGAAQLGSIISYAADDGSGGAAPEIGSSSSYAGEIQSTASQPDTSAQADTLESRFNKFLGADGDFSLDVIGTVGVSSNPFLVEGGESSAFLGFTLLPRYRITGERSETELAGRLSTTGYLQGYDESIDYGATLRHSTAINERVRASGALSFDSAIVGAASRFTDPFSPPSPLPVPAPGLEDPPFDGDFSLLGARQRRHAFQAAGSIDAVRSTTDTIGFDAEVQRVVYPGLALNTDYWSYGATIRGLRKVSARTSVGARLSVQRFDYDNIGGSYTAIKPQVQVIRTLSPQWQLDATFGGMYIDQDGGGEGDNKLTAAGSIRACRDAPISKLCLGLRRDVSGSGISGVRIINSFDANYTRSLSEDSSIGLFATLASADAALGGGQSERFVDLGATYSKRLNRRLAVIGTAGYRHIDRSTLGDTGDMRAQVSLAYRLGSLK